MDDDELIFVQMMLDSGGKIAPLIIPSNETGGIALCNPSVFVHNNQILVNVRQLNYVLYHSEKNQHEHIWGPLCYLNPENDITLRTTNYICRLNDDLTMRQHLKVDTSRFDVKPLWEFIGLEDCRLVNWEGKFFLCGVRRDTTTNGVGRMELSEIELTHNSATEIARTRMPAPGKDDSYCEKNWMTVLDKPYHWVKWTNPTEVVKFNPNDKTTVTTKIGEFQNYLEKDLRGGSQVIPFDDGYLALTHETDLYKSERGLKDATYRHRFVYWDKDFNPVKFSRVFSFMGAKIEFCCGMAEYNNNLLITFGFQDNAAFIIDVPRNFIYDFINA
jgi:predicted GH43/DUF377 family glycosyl hydrolase